MPSLLDAAFGLFATVVLAFWALYFFVVKPRIAQRALPVPEEQDLGFLVVRWPHSEVQAYVADLSSEERRRLVNLFIARAHIAAAGLLVAFGVILALQVWGAG